jgi:hypothetical protein
LPIIYTGSRSYSAPRDERRRRDPALGQRSTLSLSLRAGSAAFGFLATFHDW